MLEIGESIWELNDDIARMLIASRADAFAALDLIRDEANEPDQHLIISMVAALRTYLAEIHPTRT
jgi:hypothetical protein